MYAYAFDHTISSILTQVNNENEEHPITFVSYSLKSVEDKYTFLEKQAFMFIKLVNQFKFYIFRQQVTMLIHDLAFETILTQIELGTLIGSWVAKVQEHNLISKPIRLVRGR